MNIRIIAVAAVGSFALAACSGGDDSTRTDAAVDAATEAAATAPSDEAAVSTDGSTAPRPPVDSALAGNPDGIYPSGQTPPTLPTDPATTSPATSPPPR